MHVLAHGDIAAEDPQQLSETNFVRIFQLAQLVIEYLLHVQDVLATERRALLGLECVAMPTRSLRCGQLRWRSVRASP